MLSHWNVPAAGELLQMIAVDHSRSVAWDTAMDMVGTVVSNRLRPSTFKSWSLLLCLVMSLSQTGKAHSYIVIIPCKNVYSGKGLYAKSGELFDNL